MSQDMYDAAALYGVAAVVRVERTCVADPALRGFSLSLRRLIGRLGPDVSDPYWKPTLARLKRVRWELATVPLPPSHPALELRESAAFVSERLRLCEKIAPDHAAAARHLEAALAELSARQENPLGDTVLRLCEPSPAKVVVLRDGRCAQAVEDLLPWNANAVVAVPGELAASSRVFEREIVIGAANWFPRYIFGAPRAREICVVHFDWVRDPPMETSVFVGAGAGRRGSAPELAAYEGGSYGSDSLDSDELRPVTDWGAIEAGTGSSRGSGEERPDIVDAYLVLLASEQAVYLEAADGSRAYVVELDAGKELHMVPTRSIKPGVYLVTRLGGEGDYIPAIADALLGKDASRLRSEQNRWTDGLREAVARLGVQGVAARLTAAGSTKASVSNIRRWASGNSIRTEHPEDFTAIMRVIGLGSDAPRVWADMDIIDHAHRRAGQRVRKLLNREIQNADTRELERRGWQDYEVDEIEGEGALRVARVEARDPATVRVSARMTRQLLAVERDLWQG